MKQAIVRVRWTPSVSSDVVEQRLKVEEAGSILVEDSLDPSVNSYDFTVLEKSFVSVTLVASDGSRLSPPAKLDFRVPDLSDPVAPTFFDDWEILSIIEDGEV